MSDIKYIETKDLNVALLSLKKQLNADKIFFLVDENTERCCLPLLDVESIGVEDVIVISSGDEHKNIESLTKVWGKLQEGGASRQSLFINLGGGVVTDLGGFAASTFKRGMYFANIPTTILACVDASMGGKTGINYNGFKNEVGSFAFPQVVYVCVEFLNTLDSREILSGYAEMIKHALLADRNLFDQTISYDIELFDIKRMRYLIEQNLIVKNGIVESDPYEKGKRKALNLGHTIGHAIETLSHSKGKAIPHGYAVMWGLMGELYISCRKMKFDSKVLTSLVSFSKQYYGNVDFTCEDYDALVDLMKHDKKNSFGEINFTLLAGIGDMRINQRVEGDLIREALDFIREN